MFALGTPGPQGLEARGPVLRVVVRGPTGQVSTTALLDTGSTVTSVDADLLARVGALPAGSRPVTTISGAPVVVRQETGVQVLSEDGQALFAPVPLVLSDQLPPPVQVLIGRDALEGLQFEYDGSVGAWVLCRSGMVQAGLTPWRMFTLGVATSMITSVAAGLIWHALTKDRAYRRR